MDAIAIVIIVIMNALLGFIQGIVQRSLWRH